MKKQKPPHWRDWGLRIIRKAANKTPLRRFSKGQIEEEISMFDDDGYPTEEAAGLQATKPPQ